MPFSSLSPSIRLCATGLLIAAVGIIIQIAGGVNYPAIPPGLIILIVGAGLVLLAGRWAWTRIFGLAISVFMLIGAFAVPDARHHLTQPGHFGAFSGTIIQDVGVVIALVASLAAMRLWLVSRRRQPVVNV